MSSVVPKKTTNYFFLLIYLEEKKIMPTFAAETHPDPLWQYNALFES